ncbi:NTP transferase domain-containing protein [Sphingomonas jatrophae]|uniref:MobA-like NTP transferase domain-containing protein n=1 Tax=Sphingomonas jatrophae TaxID=1166337 RepID=A0A1I6JZI0_9SPHN|nr:NTP transferase domain-containing protein [Sphingomonas jatrophae]SFR84377.1 MobA-like NTP transferase domain-containing protein [Sphingomonas jatrophae]
MPSPPPRSGWTAIVLAGSRPGPDPFVEAQGVRSKALIDVGGKPMLGRVLETLLAVPEIARIVVLAQAPEALLTGSLAWAATEPRIGCHASGAGISTSIASVAGSAAAPWPLLVTTADHPLLTVATVRELLAGTENVDLAVGMVERRVVLSAYPGNRRTWLKLSDGAWTGANLFALAGPEVMPALSLWSGVEQDRKRVWHVFRAFGWPLFARAITRTIGLKAAIRKAGGRLGMTARLVPLSQAEAAIDVDKPTDLALAREIVARREGR